MIAACALAAQELPFSLQSMSPLISPLKTARALLALLILGACIAVAAQVQEPPRLSAEQREQLWHTLTPEQRQQFWQGMTPQQRLQLWRSLTPEQRKTIRDRLTPEQREQIRQRLLEHRAHANEQGRLPGVGARLTPDERKMLRDQIDEANRDLERERNGNERRDARPPRPPQERRK